MKKDASTAYVANAKRCAATTKAGKPCGAFAMTGSVWCFAHAPEVAQERAAARSRGGKARHGRKITRDDWKTSYDLNARTMLQRAQDVAMQMEPSLPMARTLGYLAGMTVRVQEFEELEERIAALEERSE